jgi:hypothetical protein
MRTPTTRGSSLALIALIAGVALATPARADVSESLQKKLKGQLFLSDQAFDVAGDDDAAVVKSLKKQNKASLSHTEVSGTASWHIAFLACMSRKPGVSEVSLDFYTTGKKGEYVANKRLTGISPTLTLLSSEVDLSEDDGLNAGRTYVVKLTAQVKGKDVVLAQTKLSTK